MKMNPEVTEKRFIQNFIKKYRRERSILVLRNKKKRCQFLDKFNHRWDEMIIESELHKLNSNTYDRIKYDLKFEDSDLCYLISSSEEDGTFLDFKTEYDICQLTGLASLIVSSDGLKYYLKTEQCNGAPDEFIGIKSNHHSK